MENHDEPGRDEEYDGDEPAGDTTFSIHIKCPDDTNLSLKHLLEILVSSDNYHKALGGHGLKCPGISGYDVEEVNESEYEQLSETPFANTTEVEHPVDVSYSREEVTSTVEELYESKKAKQILDDLDRTYPQKIWGDSLPLEGIVEVAFNRNR
jgi:hypothetical protein